MTRLLTILFLLLCGSVSAITLGTGTFRSVNVTNAPAAPAAPPETNIVGSTYYVVTNGSDFANGSAGAPWATAYHALSQLTNGCTLIITNGVYTESSHYIQTAAAGLPNSVITVTGPGILEGIGINVNHSNWTFNGITISNFNQSAHMLGGFVIGAAASNTRIINCSFRDFLTDQMQYGVVWYPDPAVIGPYTNVIPTSLACNCIISNNLFTNFMGAETVRVGGSNNIICNNTIARQMNGDIFQFFGCSNVIRGNFITNCFYRLDAGGGQHADMFQTYAHAGGVVSANNPYFESWGNVAEGNQFWDCYISFGQMTADVYGSNGYVARVEDFTERNNLFVRCGGQDAYDGGNGGSICSIDIPWFRAINNTYIECYKDALAGGNIIAIAFHVYTNNLGATLGQSTNDVIAGNAFIDCGVTTNGSFIGIESAGGITPFNTNNWNLKLKSNYCSWWMGSAWTRANPTWQNQIKNTSNDQNNDSYGPPPDINNGDDPKLAQWATNMWVLHQARPVYGSPLIDAGTNLLATDIEGTLRPMGLRSDIGCFEFDPNLVMHFDFDENPAASNMVYDTTGYGHNAMQMDPTNFCKTTNSVDGTVASLGVIVGTLTNLDAQVYNYTWYAAITNLNTGAATRIDFITNGTFSAWVKMATNSERWDMILDCGDTPTVNAATTNSWCVQYGHAVKIGGHFPDESLCTNFIFKIYGNTLTNELNSPSAEYAWPGPLRDGATWALLTATWTGGGNIILYYNGRPWSTNAFPYPWLRVNGNVTTPWVGLNIENHGGTPQWGDDQYPNAGALKGDLDEVRLYNRALTADEVAHIFKL